MIRSKMDKLTKHIKNLIFLNNKLFKINREYNKKWNELYRIKSEVEHKEKK